MNNLDKLTEDLKNSDSSIRAKAACELGATGFSQAVKPLLDLINTDESPAVRRECALSLARLKDSRAFSYLCDTLIDPDPTVRKAAVKAISGIQDLRTPYKLAEMFNDEDMKVRQEAYACLSLAGSAAIEPAIKSIQSENNIVRWNAAKILGNSRDPRALEPLQQLLRDEDSSVRKAAIEALGKLRNPLAFEILSQLLTTDHYDESSQIADIIDKIGGELSLTPLMEALQKTDIRLIISSLSALGRLKMTEALPAVYPFIFHPNPGIREQTAITLHNIPNSPEYLINYMGKSNADQRELIAQTLEKLEEPIGRELQMLFNGIREAEEMLLDRKDPRTTIAVMSAIKHGNDETRIPAIRLLGKTGSSQSGDLLIGLLRQNSDTAATKEIIKSIGLLPGKKGMETLMQITESSAPDEIRLQAIETIAAKAGTAELQNLLRIGKNTGTSLTGTISATIENILKKNASLSDKWQTLLCPKCLSRFERFRESVSFLKTITYYACRKCRGEKHLQGSAGIVAVLDIHQDYFIAQEEEKLKINWLKKKIPMDFDSIEIGEIDEKTLRQFAESVKNNPNPLKTKKKIEVTATEDCRLSAKKLQWFKDSLV